MNVRAVVLAAGKGTRMKSAHPKVLHEICGRPMLWYTLQALRDAGVSDTVVVTNPGLQEHIETFSVRGIVQEPQLGTGHAVQIAMQSFPARNGLVLIASADMPLVGAQLFADTLAALRGDGQAAAAVMTARMPLPSNFGRVIRDGAHVARIVEERDCTPAERAVEEMNAGVYAYDEAALRESLEHLGNENAQNEYYLTDTVGYLTGAGRRVLAVEAPDHRDVLGVNDRIELARARREMNERLCRAYMAQGVTIIDPNTTYVEPELAFGRDTIVYPNTTLARLSEIGEGCVIGPGVRLSNATIGAFSEVRESVIVDCTVGGNAAIGPYAHLRGGAELGPGVKIGNFVEIKNSKLARGVKANHLSYLGDATVGENTNVGAGTITCNYDGKLKHRSTIGKNVSIGSTTMIVAPRTIGDGALTGAGSVVVKDVAPGQRVAGNPAKPLPEKR